MSKQFYRLSIQFLGNSLFIHSKHRPGMIRRLLMWLLLGVRFDPVNYQNDDCVLHVDGEWLKDFIPQDIRDRELKYSEGGHTLRIRR